MKMTQAELLARSIYVFFKKKKQGYTILGMHANMCILQDTSYRGDILDISLNLINVMWSTYLWIPFTRDKS